MAETKIAGIMRAGAYSPNHVGNDAAIFNAVCDNLRRRGCQVDVYSEEQFIESGVKPEIIVSMCRQLPTILHLQKLESAGSLVINSAFGIKNCTRERMTRILLGSGVPYPESLIVNTDESALNALKNAGFGACWIKRADTHTQHKEDVTYCRHVEEAQEVLQEYFYRGIKRAVINRHIEGDWIKFYGVAGTPFFHWFFQMLPTGSHYCWTPLNEDPAKMQELGARLREISEVGARELGIIVYGGDCILGADGSLVIVDFNDWPSFAPCREEAPIYIAKSILTQIKEFRSGKRPENPQAK